MTHVPHLPRERIFAQLYPFADVFVLPNRSEGCGIAALAVVMPEARERGRAARARYERAWSRENTTDAPASLYRRVAAESLS